MSTLLEHHRDDVWSGRLVMSLEVLPPPIAEPVVLVRDGQKSLIFAAGAFNQAAIARLGVLVFDEARRAEVNIVYLAIAVQGGRLGSLRTFALHLAEARRHAGIVSYLQEAAYGPALWLAAHTDMTFANPSCSIGWLECFNEAGEFDTAASVGMVEDLAAFNPRVDRASWGRLLQSAVVGEQAEAMQIVGGLARDVFALSGLDANSPICGRECDD